MKDFIDHIVLELCFELSSRFESKNSWIALDEVCLWREFAACILGSQVQFEKCLKIIAKFSDNGLDRPWQKTSKLLKSESLICSFLESQRYRFPARGARLLIQTIRNIYVDNKGLKPLLQSSSCYDSARELLIQHGVGIGPKQASLFLRNIGYSDDIAILDKHILTYMKEKGLIDKELKSVSALSKYKALEKILRKKAKDLDISLGCYDLGIWLSTKVLSEKGYVWV